MKPGEYINENYVNWCRYKEFCIEVSCNVIILLNTVVSQNVICQNESTHSSYNEKTKWVQKENTAAECKERKVIFLAMYFSRGSQVVTVFLEILKKKKSIIQKWDTDIAIISNFICFPLHFTLLPWFHFGNFYGNNQSLSFCLCVHRYIYVHTYIHADFLASWKYINIIPGESKFVSTATTLAPLVFRLAMYFL